MTVKRLKELLEEAPDDAEVFAAVDHDIDDDINFRWVTTGLTDADGDFIIA